ncbi:MAG TPA: hypothetical protein VK605_09710 [Solirubrobacteraceae bacterium]|nr:hypothetical protein [Solirubrobacteraceae bacterium]
MNARAEAGERVGGRYDARVLEPSPPAVAAEPWLADDPVGRDEPRGALPRLAPVPGGDLRWRELVAQDASLAQWCADRWLAAYRDLQPAPATLVATRQALHSLAERVIAPARQAANGKIGLRFTRGGFGTPFFGADAQVRVAGEQLVVQQGGQERAEPIASLAQAAAHLGEQLLPGGVAGEDAGDELAVGAAASTLLGEWYGFGASVLEELRAGVGDEAEPSRVQLWPEHFDLSVELGAEAEGKRAGYGASPGDELHAEPYLYVTPWSEQPDGELWQASAFRGAELSYAELLSGDCGERQREIALRFFAERLAALS